MLMFFADSFFLEKYSRQLDILKSNIEMQSEDFNFPETITKFEMNKIHFVDIINIEDYEKLRRGLHKIYKKYQQSPFDTMDSRRIDDFFNGISNNINLNYWTNIITIKEIDNKINHNFDSISISLSATNHSYIELLVNINTSEKFNESILEIFKSAKDKRYIRFERPKYKTEYFNLKKWRKVTYNEYTHKKSVIEDEILELKWTIGRYLNKYIPLFFYENKLQVPSLEFISVSMTACPFNRHLLDDYSLLGLGTGTYYNNISSDGDTEISFGNLMEHDTDSSLKIFLNDVNYKNDYISFRNYCLLVAEEFNNKLLPPLIYKNVMGFYEKDFLDINKKYYRSMSYKLPTIIKMKMLVSLKINLDKKLMVFNRIFHSELEEKFSRIDKQYTTLMEIPENENRNFVKMINRNNFNKLQSIRRLINQSKSGLDEYVIFLNSIIDYRRQGRMIFISLITLVVSTIALYISLNK